MVKLEFKTRLSPYDITAVLIALAYSLVMVHFSLTKLRSFRYSSLDLGIFTQSLAGFLHGKPLFNTVEWQLYGAPNHFGVHFQPALFLLVPLFRLFPSPKTLLVLQSLTLGSSILLAYLLARKVLGERLGVALTVLYALNSSLVGINLFEFHPVSLAVPLFLLAVYFLLNGNTSAFYATSILLLLTKEDAFLGVTSLTLWWALREGFTPDSLRRNRNFLIHAGLAIVYGIIVIKIVIPHFGSGYIYGSLYSHPSLGSKKALYFLLFNLTFGLLPLFRPRNALLLTLPWLENLLASRPSQTAFGFHYPYMLVPLSFIAAVFALKELNIRKVLPVLLTLGIIASCSTMPIAEKPPRIHNPLIHYSALEPIPGAESARPIIRMLLRSNLSVYTQPDFYPALALKENVYVYPNGVSPDVVLVDTGTYQGRLYLWRLMKTAGERYRLIYSRNGVRVYARAGVSLHVH